MTTVLATQMSRCDQRSVVDAPTLVVLAAGMGSRFGGLKQMEPVGPSGETILDYSVFDAANCGFGKVVFVVRDKFRSEFHTKIGSQFEQKLDVRYVNQNSVIPHLDIQRRKPWGTGQAVIAAAAEVNGPFAVINADDFYGRQAFDDAYHALNSTGLIDNLYTLIGFRLADTLSPLGPVSRGVCQVNVSGHLDSIIEMHGVEKCKGKITASPDRDRILDEASVASMNFWAFRPTIFSQLESLFAEFVEECKDDAGAEFLLPTAVDHLIRKELATVAVKPTNGSWFGITYKGDRDHVVERIAELVHLNDYPISLWKS